MIGKVPSVFVSSTCYDLRQLRADMKDFIEGLGLNPVLSEFDSFPVDPDEGTISNCMKAVDEHADIFVLIVGTRYGSTTAAGTSVTNAEYLRARAKNVPTYTFLEKQILHILPVWRKNPTGDYSNVVDTPDLLKFADSLLSAGEQWVFPFEYVQEIVAALRVQFAYLFQDALDARGLLKGKSLSSFLKGAPGHIIRLALEKPIAWEYRLFSAALEHNLKLFGELRKDWKYGISTQSHLEFDDRAEFLGFVRGKFLPLSGMSSPLDTLVNEGFGKAVGAPGEPGDVEDILYVAKRLGDCYEKALQWATSFHRITPPPGGEKLLGEVGKMADGIITSIESFSFDLAKFLKEDLAPAVASGEPITKAFLIHLTIPNDGQFNEELQKLGKLWGL